jgi:spore maturation protein SpmA
MLPNMESAKLAVMITYVVDIILVLTMLLGLLRIRGRGGGVLDLGRLLWKQVRGGGSSW